MRILLCSNVYPPNVIGGAELVAHYQGKALIGAGHEVRVFTGDTTSIGARHSVRNDTYDGVSVRRIQLAQQDFQSDYANFSHPPVEKHFRDLLQEYRPHVVHFHNLTGLSVTIIRLAAEAGAKTVLTLHDHWGFCYKNTAMKTESVACTDFSACHECQAYVGEGRDRRIPMRMRQDFFTVMLEEVGAFVSPSRYLADTYIAAGYPKERMNVVSNGIDVARFSGVRRRSPDGAVRFSFLGYFGRHKGVHTLLEALPLLEGRSRVKVNLIGEGEQRNEYLRLLERSGCADLVRFWGKLDHSRVAHAYSETDVLVLPSIWRENQPVSITEAMASGRPVIASKMGGMSELVVDGVTGFLFKPGDPVELADRMSRFVDNPGLIDIMGARGKEMMRDNSFVKQVQQLLHIYDGLTAGGAARPTRRPLVACVGERINATAADALALLPFYYDAGRVEITMAEWLTARQLGSAHAIWVVDPGVNAGETIKLAAAHGLPLVVPAESDVLAEMCRNATCGLYYSGGDEAAACLAYLLSHEEDRLRLGRASATLSDPAAPKTTLAGTAASGSVWMA